MSRTRNGLRMSNIEKGNDKIQTRNQKNEDNGIVLVWFENAHTTKTSHLMTREHFLLYISNTRTDPSSHPITASGSTYLLMNTAIGKIKIIDISSPSFKSFYICSRFYIWNFKSSEECKGEPRCGKNNNFLLTACTDPLERCLHVRGKYFSDH